MSVRFLFQVITERPFELRLAARVDEKPRAFCFEPRPLITRSREVEDSSVEAALFGEAG